MLRRKPIKPTTADRLKRDRSAEFASFKPERMTKAVMVRIGAAGPAKVEAHKAKRAKPRRSTHKATAAEKAYMDRVAALGCVVCRLQGLGPTPAQVHHIREGQGGAQRAGNFCVVPLCVDHHTGSTGIHGDRSAMRLLKMDEIDLLDITIGEVVSG